LKGFGHITWGAGVYVIVVSAMTMIMLTIEHIEIMIASMVLAILALVVQNWEAQWDRAYKKMSAKTNATKKKFYKNLYRGARMVIMILLTFSVMILCFFHIGLMYNGLENFHFALIFAGYWLAILGAVTPDFDLTVGGVKAHRDPTTHSAMLGSVIAISFIFFVDGAWTILCFISFGLCIGMMMHLICDIIPEGSNGIKAIVSLFKWKENPGDIREIKEGREQLYLVTNGAILGFFAFFSILRSFTERVTFPAIWGINGTNFTGLSSTLFIVSILLLIAPLIMRVMFSDKRKKR